MAGLDGPERGGAGPKVYVGLFKDETVAVIDTAQNKVVGTIRSRRARMGSKDVRKLSKIEADDCYFGPTFLRGNPGQRLTLMMDNEASTCPTSRFPRSASTRTSRRRARGGSMSPFLPRSC